MALLFVFRLSSDNLLDSRPALSSDSRREAFAHDARLGPKSARKGVRTGPCILKNGSGSNPYPHKFFIKNSLTTILLGFATTT